MDQSWRMRLSPPRPAWRGIVESSPSVDAPLTAADPAPTAGLGQRLVVFGLLVYKGAISPLLPSCCKFYPTCSMYAKEAVERHGVARGLVLAVKRLGRCRPFSAGGHDPVPDA